MKKLFLLSSCLFLLTVRGYSQDQHLIDSLQAKLKQLENERAELRNGALSLRDSSSAKILNKLSRAYQNNNPDKAMDCAKQSLALCKQIGWNKGVRNAFTKIGLIYESQGNYSEALKNYFTSLKICEEEGDKTLIASCYGNIGNVYCRLGNYPEALKNLHACLKISEGLKDKSAISYAYNSIGNINDVLGNYSEALRNYYASLKLAEELDDKNQIAAILGNIGGVNYNQGNYDEALKQFTAALKMNESLGNKNGVSINYNNIGAVYFSRGNYEKAMETCLASLKIREEIGDKEGIATCYMNIGELNVKLNHLNEGKKWLQQALLKSKQIGVKQIIASVYSDLVSADSSLGDFKGALENYKMSVLYRDSLLNNENTKKITQQQMQYEFDKKEALSKAEQEKKDALAHEEIENQKLVRNGFMGGFATVLIFAGTFFRQRNRIHKEKKRSDNLLRNILPDEVAEELKETGSSKAKTHEMVSVMFTDFKDFTKISETVSAEMLVDELHTCFSAFDNILHKHNIEKIKTIGDAYMCVSGLPVSNENHATAMVKAAIEIMDYAISRKKEKDAKGEFAFELRIGINSGPVVAGIVGLKKFSYDIWGDTVNTAARMEHQGEAGKINISGTTHEMVKDKFKCTHRGKITAKNKGEIDMYFIN